MAGSGLQFAFTESVSAVTSTKPAGIALGTIRYESLSGENCKWRYVYNGGNSAIAPTYGVTLLSGGVGGYTMTLSSIASTTVGQGLVVHATIGTSQYGWVLTEGAATFQGAADVSFAAGIGVVLDANGTFAPAASSVTATSTAIGFRRVTGQAPAGIASAGSGVAFFKFN